MAKTEPIPMTAGEESFTNSKGRTYYLNKRKKDVELKNGNGSFPSYYFSKEKTETCCPAPEGMMLVVGANGVPFPKVSRQ